MKRLLICYTLLLLQLNCFSQNKELTSSNSRINKNKNEGKRKALIIGNQDYKHIGVLYNIRNDVDSMKTALEYLGFYCTPLMNGDLFETQDKIDDFILSLNEGDVAIIYYSGHGLGLDGENYLLPIEFNAKCVQDAKNRSCSFKKISKRIQDKNVRNYFLIVDACRDEAIGKECPNKGILNGDLVDIDDNPRGFAEVFAANYGGTSTYLSKNNINSLFTESLLMFLREPYEFKKIIRFAGKRTYEESKILNKKHDNVQIQEPMMHLNSLEYEDFYFLKHNKYEKEDNFNETIFQEATKLISDKKYSEAVEKLDYIALGNYKPAQSKLAYMYLNGLGVKQNIFEASKLYGEADRNGNNIDSRHFLNTTQKFNKQLLAEKKAFNQKKFLKVGGIALGAGALFLGGTAMYNSVQREADSFNESLQVWDANIDGFLDNIDFEDDYNAAADSYNQKRKLFPVSNILKIVGGGAAAIGLPIVLSKKFKGIDYNFGVGHNGQPLIFKLTKPL